jgi:response regulator RpfG family c-di-GMP phosphodiesterase
MNSEFLDGLVSAGLVRDFELQASVQVGRRREQYIEELLVVMGYLGEADLLKFQANFYKTQFISTQKLANAPIEKGLLKLVPRKLAERLTVFPILFNQQKLILTILMVQPDDLDIIKQVQFATRVHEVKALVAREAAIQAAIQKHYQGIEDAFTDRATQASKKRALVEQERAKQYSPTTVRENSLSIPPPSADDGSMEKNLERREKPRSNKYGDIIETKGESFSEDEAVPEIESSSDALAPSPQLRTAHGEPAAAIRQINSDSIAVPASIAFRDYLETVKTFVSLLEQNQGDLRGHSVLMARIGQRICERMGLSQNESDRVAAAIYLHDIGKVSSHHLTALNVAQFDGHKTQAGKSYLMPIRLFESVQLPLVTVATLEHIYERFDGTGFPDRLSGKDIPLGARVIAIIDTYMDLTLHTINPYRKKLSSQEACDVLTQFSGSIFDPSLVDVFKVVVLGDDLRERLLACKWRALVIDPDPEETTVLELRLIEKGFEVTIERNSSDIDAVFDKNDYDVIISEVDLAPMDGFAVLQKLRSGKAADIPFIFVTRRTDSDLVKRGFELGAVDYITKPTSPDVIALKISQVLEGGPRKLASRGVSGSLEEMALPDVVQILYHGRKSGKLLIESGSNRGEVQFSEGQIYNAIFGDKQGEEAFYEMLKVTSGHFELDFNFRTEDRRIQMSPESLLLEGMRRFDEEGR